MRFLTDQNISATTLEELEYQELAEKRKEIAYHKRLATKLRSKTEKLI